MTKASQKLPFLITPPIARYLDEILEQFDNRSQGALDYEKILPFSITLESYKEGEPFMSHSEDMRIKFIDYLEEELAFNCYYHEKIDYRTLSENTGKEPVDEEYYPEFNLWILDIEPIKKVYAYHLAHPNPSLRKGTEVFESCNAQYDSKEGKLVFHKKHHDFHKTSQKLFNTLWERRSHILGNKEFKKGEVLSVDELATLLGIKNESGKETLNTRLHNLQYVQLKQFSHHICLVTKNKLKEIQIKVKEV